MLKAHDTWDLTLNRIISFVSCCCLAHVTTLSSGDAAAGVLMYKMGAFLPSEAYVLRCLGLACHREATNVSFISFGGLYFIEGKIA